MSITKVNEGNYQEITHLERNSHSKKRGGKTPNLQSGTNTEKKYSMPSEHLFSGLK